MINIHRTVAWFGDVNKESLSRVLKEIIHLHKENPSGEIALLITSTGGDLQAAFAFYDLISGLNISLTTIALGETDSAAIIVFAAGKKRLVSPHTTMFFHQASRSYNGNVPARLIRAAGEEVADLERWSCEVISSVSTGKVDPGTISNWRRDERHILAEEMLLHGIAHELFIAPNTLA